MKKKEQSKSRYKRKGKKEGGNRKSHSMLCFYIEPNQKSNIANPLI